MSKNGKDEKTFDSNKKQKPITTQSSQSNVEKLKLIEDRYKHKISYYPQYLDVQNILNIPELSQIVSDYDLFCEQKCSNIQNTLTLYEGCNCIREILNQLFWVFKEQKAYIMKDSGQLQNKLIFFSIGLVTNINSFLYIQYTIHDIHIYYYSDKNNLLRYDLAEFFHMENLNFDDTLNEFIQTKIGYPNLIGDVLEIHLYNLPNGNIDLNFNFLNSLFSYAQPKKEDNSQLILNLASLFQTEKPSFQNKKFWDPRPMKFIPKKFTPTQPVESTMVTTAVIPVAGPPKSGGYRRLKKLKIPF